jgi:hypothetical protein
LKPAPDKQKSHDKKRSGGLVKGIGPEFKPQYHTHTKCWQHPISMKKLNMAAHVQEDSELMPDKEGRE